VIDYDPQASHQSPNATTRKEIIRTK